MTGQATPGTTFVEKTTTDLEFTCSRNKAAFDEGCLFNVEYSDTITAPWISVGPGVIVTEGALQTLKAIVPTGSADSRFIHLKITNP